MSLHTIRGVIHLTYAVPFTVLDDVEEGDPLDAEAWVRAVNDGSLPDALEMAKMETLDHNVHELVTWDVDEAEYVPESHVSEEGE
jgi:hypothetical protein